MNTRKPALAALALATALAGAAGLGTLPARDAAAQATTATQQMRGNRDQPQNAVERLEARSQFASLRAQGSQRFLDAFKPLYASLTDDQKKAADEMLARHGHEHGHERGRL